MGQNSAAVFGLHDKVALVTGGASGIGRATCLRLAEFGVYVVVLDVSDQLGAETVQLIRDAGGQAEFLHCDVTSGDDCGAVADEVWNRHEHIDILFNNAGVIVRKSVVDLAESEWDFVVDVSLKGVYLMSKHVIPYMVQTGGGSIVNTASGWGLKGGNAAAAYCAAKAGVVNLSKAMAIDFGPQGVRVNCVAPGDTDTPLLHSEAKQLGLDEEAFLVESGITRPLPRIGQPKDIANAVLFLVSELAAWVTGSVLVVDGGGLA